MDELLGLLTGYTPVMIFIFLCFAVLMVMFYLVLRSLDDLTAGIREERNAVIDQMSGVKLQMEDLIRVQTEERDILRAMLGPAEAAALSFAQDSTPDFEPQEPVEPPKSPSSGDKAGEQGAVDGSKRGDKGFDSENITKFIVAD